MFSQNYIKVSMHWFLKLFISRILTKFLRMPLPGSWKTKTGSPNHSFIQLLEGTIVLKGQSWISCGISPTLTWLAWACALARENSTSCFAPFSFWCCVWQKGRQPSLMAYQIFMLLRIIKTRFCSKIALFNTLW